MGALHIGEDDVENDHDDEAKDYHNDNSNDDGEYDDVESDHDADNEEYDDVIGRTWKQRCWHSKSEGWWWGRVATP